MAIVRNEKLRILRCAAAAAWSYVRKKKVGQIIIAFPSTEYRDYLVGPYDSFMGGNEFFFVDEERLVSRAYYYTENFDVAYDAELRAASVRISGKYVTITLGSDGTVFEGQFFDASDKLLKLDTKSETTGFGKHVEFEIYGPA